MRTLALAASTLFLALAFSACRATPPAIETISPTPSAAQVAEPIEVAPRWVGEPLAWEKLKEIETWLATESPNAASYWHIEGELQLNQGRFEFARREQTKSNTAAIQARLRIARAGFEHVVGQAEASPSQQKRAQDGVARVDKLLAAEPRSAITGIAIIARSAWGAMPAHPERMDKTKGGYRKITVHHSAERDPPPLSGSLADSAAAVRSIQKAHIDGKDTHWGDIGYHFLIDPSGRVFQGRDLVWQGAHAEGKNNIQNIGVCMIGNFDEEKPTKAALDTLRKMLDHLRKQYNIPRSSVYGHRDLKSTDCPGKYLEPWVKAYAR